MGYQQALANDVNAANVIATATAGSSAGNTFEETKTYLVASQTGSTTITDGEAMAMDLAAYGGFVRSNVIKRCGATTDPIRGVAIIEAGTLVIPATTAAGDRFVPVKVLRRGVKHNCAVLAGAAGNIVTPTATAGAGTGAAIGTAANTGYGILLIAPTGNLATMAVNAQF